MALVAGGYFIYTNYSNHRTKTTLVVNQTNPTPKPTESTSSNETANWKTYSSNNFNFSFQYPKEWKIQEQARGVILEITEGGKQYTIKFNLADFDLPDSDEYKNEEITLGNTNFIKQTGLKRKIPTFITLTKNRPETSRDLLGIQFIVPPTNQEKYIRQFDQLLKSIKL